MYADDTPLMAESEIELQCIVDWSVILYDIETRTVDRISKKLLEAFEMWALRRFMRFSWTECMSNERVMKLAGVRRESIQLIQEQKL